MTGWFHTILLPCALVSVMLLMSSPALAAAQRPMQQPQLLGLNQQALSCQGFELLLPITGDQQLYFDLDRIDISNTITQIASTATQQRWRYRPTQPLATGPHQLEILSTDAKGNLHILAQWQFELSPQQCDTTHSNWQRSWQLSGVADAAALVAENDDVAGAGHPDSKQRNQPDFTSSASAQFKGELRNHNWRLYGQAQLKHQDDPALRGSNPTVDLDQWLLGAETKQWQAQLGHQNLSIDHNDLLLGSGHFRAARLQWQNDHAQLSGFVSDGRTIGLVRSATAHVSGASVAWKANFGTLSVRHVSNRQRSAHNASQPARTAAQALRWQAQFGRLSSHVEYAHSRQQGRGGDAWQASVEWRQHADKGWHLRSGAQQLNRDFHSPANTALGTNQRLLFSEAAWLHSHWGSKLRVQRHWQGLELTATQAGFVSDQLHWRTHWGQQALRMEVEGLYQHRGVRLNRSAATLADRQQQRSGLLRLSSLSNNWHWQAEYQQGFRRSTDSSNAARADHRLRQAKLDLRHQWAPSWHWHMKLNWQRQGQARQRINNRLQLASLGLGGDLQRLRWLLAASYQATQDGFALSETATTQVSADIRWRLSGQANNPEQANWWLRSRASFQRQQTATVHTEQYSAWLGLHYDFNWSHHD